MILSINIFDLVKFKNLRDNNLYIQSITTLIDGIYTIEVDDTRELERLLNKNRVKYKIKHI